MTSKIHEILMAHLVIKPYHKAKDRKMMGRKMGIEGSYSGMMLAASIFLSSIFLAFNSKI